MAYLIDGIIVALFALSVFVGYKRGFIKTIAGIVAFVAAAILALLLCGPVASLAYDNLVEPAVLESVTADGVGSMESRVDAALESMPGFVTNLLANSGIHTGADVLDRMDVSEGAASLAQQISVNVVKPIALPLLELIATLVLFIVAYILLRILLSVLDVVAKLPVLKQLNNVLGLAAGALSGVLWVLFAVSLMQVAAAISGPDFAINQAVLSDATVAQWVIRMNPVGGVLQDAIAMIK